MAAASTLQLGEDLVEDDAQGQAEVEAAGDGQVDLAEGVEAENPLLEPGVEVADLAPRTFGACGPARPACAR